MKEYLVDHGYSAELISSVLEDPAGCLTEADGEDDSEPDEYEEVEEQLECDEGECVGYEYNVEGKRIEAI